jgi:hypothetical protein
LRFEVAVEHEHIRIDCGKSGADLFAVIRRLRVRRTVQIGRRPNRFVAIGETARHGPAGQHRRIDIRRLRCRPGNPHETMRAVRRDRDRTCLVAITHAGRAAQSQTGLIESVELLEDQHGQRLAEIERGLAGGAEQVALKEVRHADAGVGEIGRRYHTRWLEGAAQSREVYAGEAVRGVSRADQQSV